MISDLSEIIDYGDKNIDYSDMRTRKYFDTVKKNMKAKM